MTPSSPVRHLKTAWTWLRWPVALLVLYWLFDKHSEDFGRLRDRRLDWTFLALAFVLCFGSIVSTYVRWWMLVRSQGFEFKLRDALRIGFLSYLFNYIAPGAVGGDFVKVVLIVKEQTSRRLTAAATVAVDRIIGLVALLVTGSLVGLLPTEIASTPVMKTILSTYHAAGLGGLAAITLLMMPAVTRNPLVQLVPRLRFVGRIAGQLISALALYQSRWPVIAGTMLLSIAGHIAMLSSFYCCARGIHTGNHIPTFEEHLQFIPAAELAGVIVPLPGGVGALETAIAQFYELAGSAAGDGVLTGITYRAISIVIAAIGALCYITIRREVSTAIEEAEAEPEHRNAVESRTAS